MGRKAKRAMATALRASPIGRQIKHLDFIFFQILGDGFPGRLGVAYFLFLVCFLVYNLATGMLRSHLVALFLNLNSTMAMVGLFIAFSSPFCRCYSINNPLIVVHRSIFSKLWKLKNL